MTQTISYLSGLSPSVAIFALIVLFTIIMIAIRRRDITENLCDILLAIRGITPPKQEHKETSQDN